MFGGWAKQTPSFLLKNRAEPLAVWYRNGRIGRGGCTDEASPWCGKNLMYFGRPAGTLLCQTGKGSRSLKWTTLLATQGKGRFKEEALLERESAVSRISGMGKNRGLSSEA